MYGDLTVVELAAQPFKSSPHTSPQDRRPSFVKTQEPVFHFSHALLRRLQWPWTLRNAEVARAIAEQVNAIDYPNFKDEVQRVSGGARHHAYFDVWAVMRDYQKAEPL